MNKSEFIFRFLSNELMVVIFGEEMAVLKIKEPKKEPINLPSFWYYEAIETFNKRILN